jgi:hypothetical protein
MIRLAPLFALPLLLAACGGPVAPDAPALLSAPDLAARAAVAGTDATRGDRAAAELTGRANNLRARAAALRRTTLPQDDRADLLRRAEALNTL